MKLLPLIKHHWKQLVASIVITEVIGFLSALFTMNSSRVYLSLNLPPFAPPTWIFAPVWIVLFALIGLAAFGIYYSYEDPKKRRAGLWLYVVQLILLFIWPIMFFRYLSFWGGALIIIVLDIITVFIIGLFWYNRKLSALLMCVLFLWLLFATYLNIGVAVLN